MLACIPSTGEVRVGEDQKFKVIFSEFEASVGDVRQVT